MLWFATAALMFLRRPDALINPQFWAEDAVIFFRQQLLLGFWNSLVHPYNGYLHVIPRLIASIASWLPVRWAPLFYNAVALLISSLCCTVFAGPWCRNLLRSDRLRLVCCLVVASGLEYGVELIGVIANLQWFLTIAAAVLLFADKESIGAVWLKLLLAFVGFLIALTAPETFIFLPFLVQSIARRGLNRLLPLLMIAALAAQIVVVCGTATTGRVSYLHLGPVVLTTTLAILSRPFVGSILGHSYLFHYSERSLLLIWSFALFVVFLCLTPLIASVHRRQRRILLTALYLEIAATFLPVITRNFVTLLSSMYGLIHTSAERYFLVSAAILVFLVAFTIEHRLTNQPENLKTGLLLAIFALGIINNFRVPRYKDMHWRAYVPAVQQWISARRSGYASSSLTIPVNPQGWELELPETHARPD